VYARHISRNHGVHMPPRTAKSILKKFWDRTIPVNVDMLKGFTAKMKVRVLAHARSDDFSGEYLPFGSEPGEPPLIIYNVRKPITRQGFAIAHCLGHHVLGHGKCPRETGFSAHVSDQREKDANAFAVELLLPEEAVREYLHQYHTPDRLSVEALSRHFHVELALMSFRLHTLGMEAGKMSSSGLKRFPLQGPEKSKLHASNFYHGKVQTPHFR
jgi:Zn-dependent peptidase ImmA (M78 family)